MNQMFYESRCKSNEEPSTTRKRKTTIRSEGKPLQYPKSSEIKSKTFHIKYEKKLSTIEKLILNSFQNKYIYYAIDDILYSLNINQNEKKSLLSILYSPVLSLHNNFSVNFFDIWIRDVSIDENLKVNKFLSDNFELSEQFSSITITFFYKTRIPTKKQEALW